MRRTTRSIVGVRARRALALVAACAVIALTPLLGATSAVAATAPISQCNGYPGGALPGEPVSGAVKLVCIVSVTNNLDVSTGAMSSSTTVRRCVGAANSVPLLSNCQYGDTTTVLPSSTDLVDTVDQCNAAASTVGGSTLICYVDVTNNISGVTGTYTGYSASSVNQCVGTGGAGSTALTVGCDPYPATTSGAAITQCNGSGTGGGTSINCTVATDPLGSALPFTITQCNDSVYGGGDYIDCRASVVNVITLATSAGGSGGTGGTGGSGTGSTTGGTGAAAADSAQLAATGSAGVPIVVGGTISVALGLALVAVSRRRRLRATVSSR